MDSYLFQRLYPPWPNVTFGDGSGSATSSGTAPGQTDPGFVCSADPPNPEMNDSLSLLATHSTRDGEMRKQREKRGGNAGNTT